MTTTIPWSTMHAAPHHLVSRINMIPKICIGNGQSYIGQIQHLVEVNVWVEVFNYIILWLAKIACDHSQECLRHHISELKASFNKIKLSEEMEITRGQGHRVSCKGELLHFSKIPKSLKESSKISWITKNFFGILGNPIDPGGSFIFSVPFSHIIFLLLVFFLTILKMTDW